MVLRSRKALTYVELDIRGCANTWGVAPCTASVLPKCFNTPATCADRANLVPQTVTLRFAIPTAYLPTDIEALACLKEISFSPAIISLGENLGQRASLRAVFQDRRHSDTGEGFDKYHAERDYNPFRQGTLFGKFRARQPYLVGAKMRRITGFVGDTLAQMETRHFVVESFDGPKTDGTYEIVAKDPLKFLDGDKAQAPVLNNGFLAGDINSVVTAATLSPAGIGNSEYAASGYINIGGSEICAFTRIADALTLTRAQLGTIAASHSAQDRVQTVLYYDSEDPADIIADLIENYTGADASWIPIADWQLETSLFLQRLYTGVIPEPTGVAKLVSELIEQAALAMWWNDEDEEFRLQVLRGIQTDAVQFTERNVLENSLTTKEQPEKRVSHVQFYFAKINPCKSADDPENYASVALASDELAAADYGSPVYKVIRSRWVPRGGRSTAERAAAIILGRYKTPPRRCTFEVLRGGQEEISLGLGGKLSGTTLQAADGSSVEVPIQITRHDPDADKHKLESEEMLFEVSDDFDDRDLIIETDVNNVNLRDLYDDLFPEPIAGITVNCYINSGAIVGSVDTALPAFEDGTWPTESATGNRTNGSPIITGLADTSEFTAGMVVEGTGIPALTRILTVDSGTQITLDDNATSGAGTSTALTIYTVFLNTFIEGRIQGCGADGPFGTHLNPGSGGAKGGLALKTRYPMAISGAGEIFAGGGSGGAGGGYTGAATPPAQIGGRGGGGRGQLPGNGATTEAVGAGTNPPGSLSGRGGDGGDAGMPGNAGSPDILAANAGGPGGLSGDAIDGDDFITETGTLDVRGTRVP